MNWPSSDARLVARAVTVFLCLATGSLLGARGVSVEAVPENLSLDDVPFSLGSWSGRDAPKFDEETLKVLGVDAYLYRTYWDARRLPVNLYVGFYKSQRQGDTMHSPMNCLPGAGWQPVERRLLSLPLGTAENRSAIDVNRLVIERESDRQIVLYWYQIHRRVIASEYRSKMMTVLDAIRLNRSDAAMVRVIVPVRRSADEATKVASDFVSAVYPALQTQLPH